MNREELGEGVVWKSPAITKGVGFQIEWRGDLGQRLMYAAEKLQNFKPMLDTLGRQIKGYSKRAFLQQADPVTGDPWKPLKHQRGRGHNQNPIVLFDTGALYESVDYVLGDDWVAIGWVPKYGIYHQSERPRKFSKKGTPILPRRRFIGAPLSEIPATVTNWAQFIFVRDNA